ncbi:beta-galactosidase [Hydrocarboniphaga sp.]|uniref:beta-galactosidase n=1 Tax=Hydrocarboniphaga sp. TaxID=2033016 RepID=UPI003D14E3A5
MKLRHTLVVVVALLAALTGTADAQNAVGHPNWPGAGQLFVGANYQPVDRTPEQIHRDIALMKKAGFSVVRMGDLSWDYFQPAEGVFTFDKFDAVLKEMQANGIKVIVDIPGQPAPPWLHHKYPGVDLVTQEGGRLQAAERYMDNISDPDYRRLVKDLAEAMTKRYGKDPGVIAFGYNNEIGNGFMSYSDADRERFVAWLQKKYSSLDALNKAWATQRWSRTLTSWGQIEMPNGNGPGPFERYLDLRRYWSDVAIGVLTDLEHARRKNAPDKPSISNLWDSSERRGFDYLSSYRDYVSYGAFGYYAGDAISGAFETMMMKGTLLTSVWFNEFQAGGPGFYGSKGRSRMWAHFGLLNSGQGVLAWTFNSHLGGEEQALFGLLDHDDTPSWKLGEFATIAKEFKTLQKLGFPREVKPAIAIAYSFETRTASNPSNPSISATVRPYITTPYMVQEHNAFSPLYKDNIDVAVINIGHEDLSRYKLVVVPGLYLMDQTAADNIRNYVRNGGTVIMTAFSAKVNENNQWFNTPLPGRLSDVFGLRTSEFYRTPAALSGEIDGKAFETSINFYEVLEPSTAKVMARFSNVDGKPPVVTVNNFGKGKAIYLATPAQPSILEPLYRSLYAQIGVEPGPKTPEGVYARVVDGRTLYVNTTTQTQDLVLQGRKKGLLTGKTWNGKLQLDPLGVDLVE